MLVATTHVSIDGDILSLAETRGLLNEGATLKRSRKELLELGNVSPSLKSRRSNSPDPSTANDAMALFGFMQSVAGGAGPSEPQSKAPGEKGVLKGTRLEIDMGKLRWLRLYMCVCGYMLVRLKRSTPHHPPNPPPRLASLAAHPPPLLTLPP